MPRASIVSLAFLLAASLGYVAACTDADLGVGCESDADCDEGMTCDAHDGQGTCEDPLDHEDTSATGCAAEARADTFAIGLNKSGESVTATFVSADPAPPIKGDNTWTLTIADGGGAPLDDLTIAVTPMMPDHGHGTPVVAEVSATGNPGEYSVTPVNLFMAGYWEITFEVSSADVQDSLMFGFCVE